MEGHRGVGLLLPAKAVLTARLWHNALFHLKETNIFFFLSITLTYFPPLLQSCPAHLGVILPRSWLCTRSLPARSRSHVQSNDCPLVFAAFGSSQAVLPVVLVPRTVRVFSVVWGIIYLFI